jgi:hypothetical protein
MTEVTFSPSAVSGSAVLAMCNAGGPTSCPSSELLDNGRNGGPSRGGGTKAANCPCGAESAPAQAGAAAEPVNTSTGDLYESTTDL